MIKLVYETNKSFISEIDGSKFVYGKKIYGDYAEILAKQSELKKIFIKNYIITDKKNKIAIIKIYSKTIGYNDVIIDLEDLNKIENYKWRVEKDDKHNTMYCRSDIVINKKHKSVNIHRLITNCPKDKIIDHIDRNGLNNRKKNLRIVDPSLNGKNSRKQKIINRTYQQVFITMKKKNVLEYFGLKIKNLLVGHYILINTVDLEKRKLKLYY